jgi:fibronectin type III domain protein/List-Bact-rpt repeat protein
VILGVRSPGATAIRVHFEEFDVAVGDEVYLYGMSADSTVSGPYKEKGLYGDKEFWSGITEGDTAIIEWHSRKGAGSFLISEIGHLSVSVAQAPLSPEVLSCEIDASCSTNSEKDAVARIVYVQDSDGQHRVCTGTLLNDRYSDFRSFFLTANHCISSQTEARSIVGYWYYQTTACNSDVLRSDWTSTQGADLYAADATTDYAFLEGPPAPPGARFTGWDASPLAVNTSVYGLHHPDGYTPPSLPSYLRRADGFISSSSYPCSASGLASGYRITWTSGIAEPGSSGSGLWYVKSDAQSRLVGVLSCGPDPASCSTPYNTYSKFSDFYPTIQPFINPQNTLTVASSNPPGNGVAITVSPSDDNGASNGLTQFTRRYAPNASVTVTAPTTVTAYTFSKWQLDGVDFSSNNTAVVQMNNPHTMTAVYLVSPPQPPVATSATNVTSNSFTANWNSSTGATGYRLDVASNSSFTAYVSGYQDLNVGNVVSRNVTGLAGNTNYYYRVRAYNSGGTSNNSNIITQGTKPSNVFVTIQTSPSGRSVSVDGTTYVAPASFTWVAGQSHTIATTDPQSGPSGTQYVWNNWSDNGGISHSVTPTTDAIFTAKFTTQYRLTMNSGAGGTVTPASNWFDSGSTVQIDASVNKDFVFNAWAGAGSGGYTGTQNPVNIVMNAPITETASFTQVTGTTPFAIQNGAVMGFVANVNQSYVTAEGAGAKPLIANRPSLGAWEQFQVVDQGNGYVALRSMINGKYVCADNVGTSPLIANRDGAGTWEQFQLVGQGNVNFSLIARVNGRYVCADNNGGNSLIANRSSAGLWETFHLSSPTYATSLIPNNVTVLFQAAYSGQYVSADGAGSAPLVANRPQSGLWEQFRLETIDAANGIVALRAVVNGMYVTAESAGTSALIANRNTPGLWEQFQLLNVGGGNVALRSSVNGLYVSAGNGGDQLIANRYFAGATEQFSLLVSFRAVVNDAFVSAGDGGATPLIANQGSIGLSEQFQFVNSSPGYFSLKAKINGMYVCADNNGNDPLIANRPTAGLWEQFQWIVGGGGNVVLKAAVNGMYVCAERGGQSALIANRSSAGTWEQFH